MFAGKAYALECAPCVGLAGPALDVCLAQCACAANPSAPGCGGGTCPCGGTYPSCTPCGGCSAGQVLAPPPIGACITCTAGWYCTGGSSVGEGATECAKDKYSAPGSSSSSACTSCPSGYRRDCAGAAASSTPSGQDSCKLCQCSAGYYGDGVTCTRCPNINTANGWTPSTIYGTTSGAGATAIANCYIPSGTTGMSDGTGTFTAGANCSYM